MTRAIQDYGGTSRVREVSTEAEPTGVARFVLAAGDGAGQDGEPSDTDSQEETVLAKMLILEAEQGFWEVTALI